MKIKNFIKENLVLIIILVVAALLRFIKLGSIPPHLTPDEASLGYNAYSILKTGRDEYGKLLPIIFKSFGDYKPGLYVYFSVPWVFILGLTEFSVRLAGALSGVIIVFLVFLITWELFKDKKISLISAFVAALNPWLIYFSRGAWEANVSLTFTLIGIYFFLKFLEKEKYLLLSALFFGLTILTYQGAKLSSGLVVLLLLTIYFKKIIKSSKKILLGSFIVGLIVSLPIILSLFQGKTGRLSVFSVFSYPRPKEYIQTMLNQGKEKIGDLNYYLFHSEANNFLRGVAGRWFNHFSGRFLFFEGDWQNPKQGSPYMGVMLLIDLPLLVLGFIYLIKQGLLKQKLFVLLWLCLAPLPAVLSRDQVQAVRSLNMSIPLIILSSLGLYVLINNTNKMRKVILTVFGLLYLANYIYFLDSYFIHLSKHNSNYWYFGYREVVKFITPIQKEYKSIQFQQSYNQPYIYFLFYQRYDPIEYQKQALLKESGYGDVGLIEKLDNIRFSNLTLQVNENEKPMLIVGDGIKIPEGELSVHPELKEIYEVKYLNDLDTAFRVLEAK